MNSVFKLIAFILGMNLMVACTIQKETIRESAASSSKAPGLELPAPIGVGGTDSAGGNGVDGKPLESYSKDVRSKEEFATVRDIILNLSKVSPKFASDLIHIAKERRWYFLATSLDTIPHNLIGAGVKTEDQVALQNLGEVWVDTRLYEKMSLEDKSILILHELVMGARLMEFQDGFDNCISASVILTLPDLFGKMTKVERQKYKEARSRCYFDFEGMGRSYDPLLGKKIELNKEDYLNVRYLVTELWSTQGLVSDEIESWIAVKKIRRYK